MFDKSISGVSIEDISRLIADGIPEGRHLEFKVDIPVSEEAQKAQRKSAKDIIPVDRSWLNGSLAKHGRDALAAEVVAFANSDGGVLIIGIDETQEAPARARAINILPDVARLERCLRDSLIDRIDPRLPYCAVRGLVLDDEGGGVILIEVGASTLGPHWVRPSQRPTATVRREDRCDSMSMPEVHEMVLRHARRLDALEKSFEAARTSFVAQFDEYVRSCQLRDSQIERASAYSQNGWLEKKNKAALGLKVALIPHLDLSIPRLELADGLNPASDAISLVMPSGAKTTNYVGKFNYSGGFYQRILGGVEFCNLGEDFKKITILRNGQIYLSINDIFDVRSAVCRADMIAGAIGFSIGAFDRLRSRSNYPAAPADVSVDVCTRGLVGVDNYKGVGHSGSQGRLPSHAAFPRYSFGSVTDFEILIQNVCSDLMNAAGLTSSFLPKVKWSDPH